MLIENLDAIMIADIQKLVDDEIPEGRTIEYKRELYRLSGVDPEVKKKQCRELLKDVSSFANSVGGDLIIGIDAVDGVPVAVCGFECTNVDALKNTITEIIQNGLEPRIGFAIHSIPVSAGKEVLVIRVRRSMLAPHRVVHHGEFGPFWERVSAAVQQMDTSQLRLSFNLSETLNERIRNFRRERIQLILSGNSPIALSQKAMAGQSPREFDACRELR